jgi:glutamyl-Q tRNA(Asp) synthetase
MLAARPKKAERRLRFAPSPNGFLHRGHAYSALLNFRATKVTGGRFLLRIEDIDRTRARQEFEDAIFEDLGWLGLTWEEPVLRQRDRFDAYANAVAELERLDLLYPAFLSRTEIDNAVEQAEASGRTWPRDPDGTPHYPGQERDWSSRRRREAMDAGKPYALRLDMARALADIPTLTFSEADPSGDASPILRRANPAVWGDVVLARKEMPMSYHLAVVVDDAFQGVTDVVRGKDLEAATSVHRVLQTLLGLPEPTYFHHRLILDERGEKLSKSRGSETIRGRREAGENAEELIAGLGL